jgi:cytochrome c-type biogenesis protein CcmF
MALFFLAILVTFSQQQTISRNTSGFMLGESFSEHENLLLIRDEILPMGEYHVTYSDRQISGEDIVYQIDFLKKNQDGEFYKAFSSFPSIKLNERMGNVYNPYAKIYLTRDIFTYITFADVHSHTHHHPPQLLEQLTLTRNDTVSFENNKVVLTEIDVKNRNIEGDIDPDNIVLEAVIEFITHFGRAYRATPAFRVQDQQVIYDDAVVTELDYRVRFKGVTEKAYTIDIEIYREQPDFIIIKTIIFPYINLLWISCFVMLLGFWLSFRKRWKSRNKPVAEIENE